MNIYVFAYAAPSGELGRRSLRAHAAIYEAAHMLRDGDAQQILLDALLLNHRRVDTIPNYPPAQFGLPPAESPRLPPRSMLLLATRPPMNDDPTVDRKKVLLKSETALERDVIGEHGLGRFVKYCSRTEVELTVELACGRQLAELPLYNKFHTVRGAPIMYRGSHAGNKRKVKEKKTVGYLIYLPSIGRDAGGPALLTCFGMSGVATLVWSLFLQRATEHDDNVLSLRRIVEAQRPRLIAADFTLPEPDVLPPTLRSMIAEAPEPRVVIDVEVE